MKGEVEAYDDKNTKPEEMARGLQHLLNLYMKGKSHTSALFVNTVSQKSLP